MIELEPIEGVATKEQLQKFEDGAIEEIKVLKDKLDDLKSFIIQLKCVDESIIDGYPVSVCGCEDTDVSSSEAASQHFGYLESKIMESIGTIDKIGLELVAQIDRGKENANTTPVDRERLPDTEQSFRLCSSGK